MEEQYLIERFDEIFGDVCKKYDMKWYEVFESEYMDEVAELIVNEFGFSIIESDEYRAWYKDMAEDL